MARSMRLSFLLLCCGITGAHSLNPPPDLTAVANGTVPSTDTSATISKDAGIAVAATKATVAKDAAIGVVAPEKGKDGTPATPVDGKAATPVDGKAATPADGKATPEPPKKADGTAAVKPADASKPGATADTSKAAVTAVASVKADTNVSMTATKATAPPKEMGFWYILSTWVMEFIRCIPIALISFCVLSLAVHYPQLVDKIIHWHQVRITTRAPEKDVGFGNNLGRTSQKKEPSFGTFSL